MSREIHCESLFVFPLQSVRAFDVRIAIPDSYAHSAPGTRGQTNAICNTDGDYDTINVCIQQAQNPNGLTERDENGIENAVVRATEVISFHRIEFNRFAIE